MSNFFSSDVFIESAGAAFYPRKTCRAEFVSVAGRQFKVLTVDGKPQTDLPFADFYEALASGAPHSRRLRHVGAYCHRSMGVDEWTQRSASKEVPSPWIDWRRFSAWEQFVEYARERSSRPFRRAQSKRNKLAKHLGGDVRFEFEVNDAELIERCFEWKSAQYLRTNLVDMFASEKVKNLFRGLHARNALTISAVFVGNQPVAVHLGTLWEERFYYWVPVYDSELGEFSPGSLLLEGMLEASYGRGHREFDFLIGGEQYKLGYATDVRLIGELGAPPLGHLWWRRVRRPLMAVVRRNARFYAILQRLKRKVTEVCLAWSRA